MNCTGGYKSPWLYTSSTYPLGLTTIYYSLYIYLNFMTTQRFNLKLNQLKADSLENAQILKFMTI